jgi:hypothetical protein
VNGLVHLEVRHIVFDLRRDLLGQAADRQRTEDDAELATGDHASALAERGERDLDVDFLVQFDLDEVDVEQVTRNGVVRVVTDENRERRDGNAQLDHRVLAVLALEDAEQLLGGDGEVQGGGLFAVCDGRDLPTATETRGHALARARPLLRLHLDNFHDRLRLVRVRQTSAPKGMREVANPLNNCNAKSTRVPIVLRFPTTAKRPSNRGWWALSLLSLRSQANNELTESLLWIRRIASPTNGPTLS